MPPFSPGRVQDAALTIRGFKYQVQLTLLRWFDLQDGETLFLECGEDIDRVLSAPNAAGQQRELEQVKARGRNVTLRSSEVLCALANFASHINANPGASLRFRFTTTASVGCEKLSPLGKGTRAIATWSELQGKKRWSAEDDAAVRHLSHIILERAARPEKCSQEAWRGLRDIVSGVGNVSFPTFILGFEWSCGSASPDTLDDLLINRLGDLPGDTGPTDISRQQRYNQLFFAVMDLLSRPGEKKLTRDLLKAALERPTLTEHDRARIKLLEERDASQAEIVSGLQAAFQRIDLTSMAPLLFGHAASELKSLNISAVLSEPPPLVAALSRRSETVTKLSKELTQPRLMWIHGDYGMGKSHLGFLVADPHGGIVLGASMRGLTSPAAEHGLTALISTPGALQLLQSVNTGVVLLDDLPECEPQSRLEALVTALAKAILATGRTLILSSRRPPSSTLEATFGANLLAVTVPPFSNADARELFVAHGVAETLLTEKRVESMNAICSGHPMLLTALARHLLTRPTEPDKALVEAILASKHRAEIDLATSRAVLGTVEAEACRKLLFRLASSGTAMNLDEIRSIAAVDPALPEPTGCVARLEGLWLRRTAKMRYEVSPLASPLWREVPEDVNRAVHSRIARLVIARRNLSVSEFMRAITSMVIAGEHNAAASHLIYGCVRWPNKAAGYADLGVLLFFPPHRDQGLDPVTELPLRGAQAVTAAIDGSDPKPYLDRISTIVSMTTPEVAIGAILAGSIMLTSSLSIPFGVSAFGGNLIEQFRASPLLPKEMTRTLPGFAEGVHLLLPTACIRSWSDLDAFIEQLASLSAQRRSEVASLPELRHGMQTIVWRPLFDEKLAVSDGAYERLGRVEARSRELGLTLCAAYAAAGQLVVLGEFEHDVGRMLQEAVEARQNFAHDPFALAVIEATVGQQLYINKEYSGALKHLALGLADPSHIIGLERGNRLVDAISAAWELPGDPGPFVDELTQLLTSDAFALSEMLCQFHAQIAVVRWRQDRREEAYRHLESSVVRFLELKDSTRTRQLGAAIAHTLSYCAAVAETGKPPPKASDGGPYVEPAPRMFSGTNEGLSGMWRSRHGPAILQWMLGRLADALGIDDAYSTWTDRALEAAEGSNGAMLLSMLAPRGIAAALRRAAWEDSVDAAVTYGRAYIVVKDEQQQGKSAIDDAFQFDPQQAPATPELRAKSEEWSLWALSRVIVAEIGSRMLQADQSRAALEDLAGVIERTGEQLQLTKLWRSLAKVVRLACGAEMTDQQHKEALADTSEPGSESVCFVAHGLLALREDVRLGQAAVSQLGVLCQLAVMTRHLEVPVDAYAAAVGQYWTMAIERASFQFTAPRELARAVHETRDSAPLPRAKAILRAVLSSLAVPCTEENRKWLSE